MAKSPRDIGASVRARLQNLARERGQVFDLLLTRYALERLLYRLSLSAHRNRFVLKGAMLVTTWFEDPHRPTRDLDLLGYGDSSAEAMSSVWKEIFEIAMDDGITFDSDPLRIDPIREEIEYGGLHTEAEIAQLLNRKGLTSGTGKRFHRLILRRIRSVYGLKSRYKRLRSRGLLTNVRWQNGYTSATPPSNYGGARVFSRRTAMTTKTSICLNVPPRWRQ